MNTASSMYCFGKALMESPVGTPTAHDQAPLTRQDGVTTNVSWASARLRALATLSGSLTDPLDPDDAARLVEQEAFAALGTTSAVVVTLGHFPPVNGFTKLRRPPNDARLHLVHAIGVTEEISAALRELPLDAPIPFAEVARSGEPLFLESSKDLKRYPEWGAAMIRAGAEASAIVPVWANGELRGVLGLSWPTPHIFDEDERAFVLTLGVMCAQAILRAYLRASESAARSEEHTSELQSQSNLVCRLLLE